ncbi:PspC domain-containing protein [Levilactobacillus brevis]|uniref:PspC domain-containing protein n=1 Tax=Levilactobacillus brevis TaxID=1580 RepID=UPI000A203B63|nr:PspC domain-containing protein [Levilactobacillus brevis]ARN91436.1 PspC domain-containing protein [Levilactobacillus brevis]ARN94179.1 PspC domain-containing protein [Levilactobacillus brevis]
MHIKIKRSRNNRVFAGVIGGIAENYDWNANVLRVIWVILTLTPFPGLIAYLVLWLLMEQD